MHVRCYRDLEVWQFGIRLTQRTYQLTRTFPKHELYGLCNQMQRAAVSIPANIAEGHARSSTKEFLHHLSIARGSLAELETLLVISQELEYCQPTAVAEMFQSCDHISRMIAGLQHRLTEKLQRDA
ncbi:MAG: four helix bundle protein [Planctomycetaceae bacterium]|nr:four helix bundle protein [Planctomycetaceae bacterium]